MRKRPAMQTQNTNCCIGLRRNAAKQQERVTGYIKASVDNYASNLLAVHVDKLKRRVCAVKEAVVAEISDGDVVPTPRCEAVQRLPTDDGAAKVAVT